METQRERRRRNKHSRGNKNDIFQINIKIVDTANPCFDLLKRARNWDFYQTFAPSPAANVEERYKPTSQPTFPPFAAISSTYLVWFSRESQLWRFQVVCYFATFQYLPLKQWRRRWQLRQYHGDAHWLESTGRNAIVCLPNADDHMMTTMMRGKRNSPYLTDRALL